MHYTTLGKTGLIVSRLALGTMTFGEGISHGFHHPVNQERATNMVAQALEAHPRRRRQVHAELVAGVSVRGGALDQLVARDGVAERAGRRARGVQDRRAQVPAE